MIVCGCRSVTDREIRRAVVVAGARTAEDVAAACGAGSDCGCCRAGIEELLDATICVRRRPRGDTSRRQAVNLLSYGDSPAHRRSRDFAPSAS